MATPYLPDPILDEIFSRLPTKSAGRCRCLSKYWRQWLSTPQFIKSHLAHKPYQENLILITNSRSLQTINHPVGSASIKDLSLEFPNTWSEVVNSCNGLVLLSDEWDAMFLVNPVTREQVNVPKSPLVLNLDQEVVFIGLGYDAKTDDYKIIQYSCIITEIDPYRQRSDMFLDVYSLKLGIWRRIDPQYYSGNDFESELGTFMNGALHWYSGEIYPDRGVIVTLDLAEEVFGEIQAPASVDWRNGTFKNSIAVIGERMCWVNSKCENGQNFRTDFWMMEEYGVGNSWAKLITDAPIRVSRPLCLIGHEEVVYVSFLERALVVRNLKDGSQKYLVIVNGVPGRYRDSSTFVDSLVSPIQH